MARALRLVTKRDDWPRDDEWADPCLGIAIGLFVSAVFWIAVIYGVWRWLR